MVSFDAAFSTCDDRDSIRAKLTALGYNLSGDLNISFFGINADDMQAAGLKWAEASAVRFVQDTYKAEEQRRAGASSAATAGKMVTRPAAPPSLLAKYSYWYVTQERAIKSNEVLVPTLSYRPLGCEPEVSVTLLDPELACICDAFLGRGEHATSPSFAQMQQLIGFTSMAGHFGKKAQRRDEFLRLINALLGADGQLMPNFVRDDVTDGSLLEQDMPIVILQVKNSVGMEGDPGVQGQEYYRLYLLDRANKPGTAAFVRETPCPCLLLELMGSELRVSALASTQDVQVICQPLTPRLHLYNMFGHNWEHMVVLAKALRAFKFGVGRLREHYRKSMHASCGVARPAKQLRLSDKTDQPLDRNVDLLLPYPLRNGFCGSTPTSLPEVLQQGRQLYRCRRSGGSGPARLVKFVQHGGYGEEVHRAWAREGLAPELYEVRQLPGGCCMVEMEELRLEDGWQPVAALPEQKRTAQLLGAVQAALKRAHQVALGGGRFGVHGDARASNVLVRLMDAAEQPAFSAGGEGAAGEDPASAAAKGVVQQLGPAAPQIQVRFVDFDWAGVANEAELPLWAVPWDGLPDDRKLTPAYDEAVLAHTWLID